MNIPVFPNNYGSSWNQNQGMTLRDFIAVTVLQAEVNDHFHQHPDENWREKAAEEAYLIADAMMKAREE